jgi:hypothetical protein
MAVLSGTLVKQFVGKPIRIAFVDGQILDAHLLSFQGASLWLVRGDEDRFVALSEVVAVTALAPAAFS